MLALLFTVWWVTLLIGAVLFGGLVVLQSAWTARPWARVPWAHVRRAAAASAAAAGAATAPVAHG